MSHSRPVTIRSPFAPDSLRRRALGLSLDDVGLLLTLADEPGLVFVPGEGRPLVDPSEILAARLANAWFAVRPVDDAAAGAALRAAGFTLDEAVLLLERGAVQ